MVARRDAVGPLNKQNCEIYPQTITVTFWRPNGRWRSAAIRPWSRAGTSF